MATRLKIVDRDTPMMLPPDVAENATFTEEMIHRLKTKKGKDWYKLRKQTVEPVFGTIKETTRVRAFPSSRPG